MRRGFPSKQPKNLDPFYKTDLDFCCLGGKNFFPNNPQNLDPFYKTDLDFGDCLGGENLSYNRKIR